MKIFFLNQNYHPEIYGDFDAPRLESDNRL